MLQPMEGPPASRAAAVGGLHDARAAAGEDGEAELADARGDVAGEGVVLVVFLNRAEPKTVTQGPTKWRARKPLMNSAAMRTTRKNSTRRVLGPSRNPTLFDVAGGLAPGAVGRGLVGAEGPRERDGFFGGTFVEDEAGGGLREGRGVGVGCWGVSGMRGDYRLGERGLRIGDFGLRIGRNKSGVGLGWN